MHSWGAWDASWSWSLALIAITITIHVTGIGSIANVIERLRGKLLRSSRPYLGSTPKTIAIIVLVALALALLHGIESLTWAIAYVHLGAFGSPADAVLYSVDSMTTRGASGLIPVREWSMMGAAEAGDGMLLFGISTAFLFYAMTRLWKIDLEVR
jgi:type IV secretory pathway VirB2 component (pilin)